MDSCSCATRESVTPLYRDVRPSVDSGARDAGPSSHVTLAQHDTARDASPLLSLVEWQWVRANQPDTLLYTSMVNDRLTSHRCTSLRYITTVVIWAVGVARQASLTGDATYILCRFEWRTVDTRCRYISGSAITRSYETGGTLVYPSTLVDRCGWHGSPYTTSVDTDHDWHESRTTLHTSGHERSR